MNENERIRRLIGRGVRVIHPESLDVAAEVMPERIAAGVTLHAGVRLRGADLSIGPDCEIGAEGPATLENCRLGRGVELRGGCFTESVFLDGVHFGGAAQVRAGTIMEEEASAAHAVGLKQTIFFPFVTAGSLINFCDALMAGGTGRKDHGEIGSSYIHFNFTPHSDKATASLIGDVPHGVRLDQPPVFLGGQGGLVGPVRIAYGTVIPAGCIVRKDMLTPGQIHPPPPAPTRPPRPFTRGMYRSLRRIVTNNFIYMGNLHALRRWYAEVRRPFASGDFWTGACVEGALEALDLVLEERTRRLRETIERVAEALRSPRAGVGALDWTPALESDHRRWRDEGAEAIERAARGPDEAVGGAARDRWLAVWAAVDRGGGYVAAVRALPDSARLAATEWLQAVVDATAAVCPFAPPSGEQR